MKKKKVLTVILIILIAAVVIPLFYVNVFNSSETINNSSENANQHTEVNEQPAIDNDIVEEIDLENVEENDYYVVYINNTDGSNTSYVPTSLNPGFKETESYNISIVIDDNGNIVNDEKIIVVNEYILSESNKVNIREILSDERRASEAITELQEELSGIQESKENSD